VCVEAIIACSVEFSGDLRETSVCLLAVPIMTLNAHFSGRGIILGGALAVLAIAAALVIGNPQAVVREPPIVVAPTMLVIAWAMLSTPLMRSDIEHRRGARIDPLTGMLNRAALIPRAEKLGSQWIVAPGAIGVVLCDIEHFKAINDSLGHQAGDGVLREFATSCESSCGYTSPRSVSAARSS
jgi:predicted signal transduction protein with EAL and GGDEF domain